VHGAAYPWEIRERAVSLYFAYVGRWDPFSQRGFLMPKLYSSPERMSLIIPRMQLLGTGKRSRVCAMTPQCLARTSKRHDSHIRGAELDLLEYLMNYDYNWDSFRHRDRLNHALGTDCTVDHVRDGLSRIGMTHKKW
jgi:hypothetical protein